MSTASPIPIPIPSRAGASSPAIIVAPHHPHASSLGTINEVASATDLGALDDIIQCGAPISGQYAKNGLWDDESDSDKEDKDRSDSTLPNSASNGRSWRQRLSSTSVRAAPTRRSRAGTLTGASSPVPEGGWPWNRKSTNNTPTPNALPIISPINVSPPLASPTAPPWSAPLVPPVASPFASSSSERSSISPQLSFTPVMPDTPVFPSSPVIHPIAEDTLPLPSTKPSSSVTTTILIAPPPMSESGPTNGLKLSKSRSRLRSMGMGARSKGPPPELLNKVERKIEVLQTAPILSASLEPRTPLSPVDNAQVLVSRSINPKMRSGTEDPKPKSAWKRGVERLWRSKSASGLRDSFQRRTENDPPPVPPLPRHHQSGGVGGLAVPTHPGGSAASAVGGGVATYSPTTRDSVLIPHDDPIYSELDKRYPSYPARAPPGHSPVIANDETFESDPFASVVDYASRPRSSSRASRITRSPIPEFSASLPPTPQLDPPRPISMKTGLMPRLRKSKSMAGSRPSSIVGLFTDRKKSVIASPKVSKLAMNERSALDELASTTGELEPPKPLFYDSFDIASDDETEPAAPAVRSSNEWSQPCYDAPLASPTTEVLSSQHYTESAPELLIETNPSNSGHSAEIATPVPHSAPAHVTWYERELGDGIRNNGLVPLERANSKPLSNDHQQRPASFAFEQSSISSRGGPRESASFHDLYSQLGIWPEQADQWLVEQLPECKAIPKTTEPTTDDPARDDHSACDPSPLSTPGVSWEASISSFPIIDDLILPPSHSYQTSQVDNVSSDGMYNNDRESLRTASSESSGMYHQLSGDSRHRSDESWRDVPREISGPSSSRDSGHERRRQAAAPPENGWSIESESSDEAENDDVPLSKLHPAAGAAQEKRLVDAVRRREARRAERERELRQSKSQLFDRERERLVKRERELHREASRRDHPGRSTRSPAEWNGEGGVPADMLAGRLERVAVSSTSTHQSRPGATASTGVSRAQTMRVPSGGASAGSIPNRTPRLTHTSQDEASSSTPTTPNHGATMSRTRTIGGGSSHSHHSGGATRPHGAPLSLSSSRATTSSNSGHSAPVGRSNTTASRRRATSNARDQPRSPVDAPPVPRRGVPVRCVIAATTGERPLSLEIFPETTTRDVLARAREAAHLVDGSNGPTSGWVVCEIFSEMGLERQLREYEIIANVTRGWDGQAKGNCLVVRESHHANHTLAKSVSDSAPMVGGYVQVETKPGKWNKRWLETRGGHIFLSKNEKGKEEMQINTLFSDVYTPSQTYPSPQRHVFALKRLEALASFENPSEHIHYISTDDANGWKLSTASYGARSFTLVSAQKHAQISHTPHAVNAASSLNPASSLKRAKSQSHGGVKAHVHGEHPLSSSIPASGGTIRRPSRQPQPQAPQPLVDLKAGLTRQPTNTRMKPTSASGFTGKGLLGNI